MTRVLLCDERLCARWPGQAQRRALLAPLVDHVVDVNTGDLTPLAGADVLSFGWFRFCQRPDALAQALHSCHRLIQIVTDYEHPPITQVRRAVQGKPNIAVANLRTRPPGTAWAWATEWRYLNWNLMAWEGEQPRTQPVQYVGLLYYGRWRPDRVPYFQQWLMGGYPVRVSTGPKAIRKFAALSTRIIPHDRLAALAELQRYELALYVEDVFTHTHYNSPAARFYECLSWGIPQVFDESCRYTFAEADIPIGPWVMAPSVLARRWHPMLAVEWLAAQRGAWRRDYRGEFDAAFQQVMPH